MPDGSPLGRARLRDYPADPDPGSTRVADALQAQADAMLATAEAINAFRVEIGPAAATVHDLGRRLDLLCSWLTGKWPWVIGVVGTVVIKLANSAPEEAWRLVAMLAKGAGQ